MDAGAKGVLRFTDDDCPYMDLDKEEGTQRMWLAFPAEAIGVQDEGGMRHITDPDGRVYGTEDELLASRGGALHSDAVRNECQDAGESTFVFGIMHEPADQVIDLRPPFDPKGPSSDTAVTSPGAQ